MALTITATITLAAEETYSPLEARIVAAMQAHPANGETPAEVTNPTTPAALVEAKEEAAAEPVAEEKPKRAPRTRKAAPAPESSASTIPAVLDTSLDEAPAAAEEPAVEEADEDLLGGGDEAEKEYTMEDAVSVATPLLKGGKQAEVKEALEAAGGAKRVSELKGANIGIFIKALQG